MRYDMIWMSKILIKAALTIIFVASLLIIIAEDAKAYEVGDTGPAGGIVISIINSDHGVESAKEDYLAMGIGGDVGSWDEDTYDYLNDLAPSYKYKHEGVTYDGWRVPTLEELYGLFNLSGGDSFEDSTYWSSTVLNTARTTSIDFMTGSLVKGSVNDSNRMRFVRDF